MTSTLTFGMNVTTNVCRVTDTTDYPDLGFNLATANARGYLTVWFQGEIIYQKNTLSDPAINLAAGATYCEFPAVLDNNGVPANGSYTLAYSVRMAPTELQFLSSGTVTTLIGDGDAQYADFLETGDTLIFDGTVDTSRVITTVDALVSGNPSYTLASSIDLATPYDSYNFDATHQTFNQSYTYKGCTQLEACAEFTYDCDYGNNGTWSVSNSTKITSQTLISLSATITWPGLTGLPPIVVTSLPYTNNQLANGTYTIDLSEVIEQTQADGLILTYTATYKNSDVQVSCLNGVCSLIPCINKLQEANAGTYLANAKPIYQPVVDNVLLGLAKATAYKDCGDLDNYRKTLAAVKEELDGSGVDCGCCDDQNAGVWVYNTSQAAQDAIAALQAAVFNPSVYTTVLFQNTFQYGTAQNDYPNDNDYVAAYADISAITIPKKYFDTAPNGNAKKFVVIEITSYQSSADAQVRVTAPDNILYQENSPSEDETTKNHRVILTTASLSSLVANVVTAEARQISNSTNGAEEQFFNSNNYGVDLWDLSEDLVLDFTPFVSVPSNIDTITITNLTITAVAIP